METLIRRDALDCTVKIILECEETCGNEGISKAMSDWQELIRADILMVADGDNIKLGTPYIEGGKVVAKVKAHGRHKKIEIIKFNRRKHYDKRTGHRQNYTELEITDIQAG